MGVRAFGKGEDLSLGAGWGGGKPNGKFPLKIKIGMVLLLKSRATVQSNVVERSRVPLPGKDWGNLRCDRERGKKLQKQG